jgi:hypothetical protein
LSQISLPKLSNRGKGCAEDRAREIFAKDII